MRKHSLLAAVALFCLPAWSFAGGQTEETPPQPATAAAQQTTPDDRSVEGVDPAFPAYSVVSGVSGNLNSIGSDTLNNILQLFAEGFRAYYPNVNIQIQGAGSSTAPPALIDGTAQLGPMSRTMSGSELDAFVARHGYRPTAVPVGIDAIGVFVHRDNPISGLTLRQIDAMFSNTYRLGGSPITTWGQVGLTGDWANRPISLYGRNSVSGTYGVFKDIALGGGDYDPDRYQEQPGSSTVVQSITADRFGIGYSGIGYLTSGVRAIPVGRDPDAYFEPSAENAVSADYPLARLLYVYINKDPNRPLDALTYEFLRFALSRQGQGAVVRDGFYPLPASLAEETLESLR
ncbi:MAG: PstS family phosphate ABC transporter substrate-binding protein [Spirochaetota bacterium]